MKTKVLCIALLFLTIIVRLSKGQDALDLFYYLRTTIPLQECSSIGDTSGFEVKSPPGGAKFTVVDITNGGYVIRFWTWNPDRKGFQETSDFLTTTVTGQKKIIAQRKNDYQKTRIGLYENFNIKDISNPTSFRYFLISKSALTVFAEKLTSQFSPIVGTVVLPFKYRFSPVDFGKDLTLSSMGGVKVNCNPKAKFSSSVLLGVGISNVVLDSTSTEGKIKNSQDRAAITLSAGLVLQWQFLQAGMFVGWDWLSKRSTDNWKYQGQPWIGFGIGLAIFNNEGLKQKETNQDKN